MDTRQPAFRLGVLTVLTGLGLAVVLLAGMAVVAVTLLGGAGLAGLAGAGGTAARPASTHGTAPVSAGTIRPAAARMPPGRQLWVSHHAARAGQTETAVATAVSPDGSMVFTTGSDQASPTDSGYVTVGYDAATGRQVWASQYAGSGNGLDQPAAIAVSPDGSTVYVTGTSAGPTTGADFATVAYDAKTGATLWVSRWAGPGADSDRAAAIGVTNGGTVLVTGSSTASLGSAQVTIAYNAMTGAALWVSHYAGGYETASALAVGPLGGTVYVTGSSRTPGAVAFVTVAYDIATGSQRWAASYLAGPAGPDQADQPHGLAVSQDGQTVAVTGTAGQASIGTAHDYATVTYDAVTGMQLWASRYDGPASGLDEAHSVAISPDGLTIYVTGASTGAATVTDYATVAYNAGTGAQLWVARYNASGIDSDSARTVAASPDGRTVYVTGVALLSTGPAGIASTAVYTTIAYDAATGAREWTATAPDGSPTATQSLALTPKGGTIYLASTQGNGDGFATIAYQA